MTENDLRRAVVAEARGWLGTPFRHGGRCRGAGVDCIGLAIGVAKALGLPHADAAGYPRRPDEGELARGLDRLLTPCAPEAAKPGDLLRLSCRGRATHVAIVTERGILHAHAPSGRVIEHGYDGCWPGPAVAAYRLVPAVSERG
ncbi:C40 family peptidase [Fodinicurvata halophila]|uniref:C40 family peptidase n=1 Tax=Fodinicurvata halophila TaxID=1419723 RepID=A0ABV8UQM4_9PROT